MKQRGVLARRAVSVSAMAVSACAGLSMPVQHAAAQQQGSPAWTGEMGITETVAQIMARNAANPDPFRLRMSDEREDPDRTHLPQGPGVLAVPRWPYNRADNLSRPLPRIYPQLDPVDSGITDSPQTLGLNFLAVSIGQTPGFIPPDTQAAVGPTQIVSIVNGNIKTFNKTTGNADGALNATTDNFFGSVRNGSGTSDPQVRYDRLSQRWFVLIINVASQNNRFLLAVSSGPTITNSSSFTFFFFQQNTVAPAGDTNLFADYPSLGVDVNALYTGANMFNGGTVPTSAWVIQKASVLGAGPIGVTAFRNLGGPWAPRGVDNDDPAATQGYIIGPSHNSSGVLVLRRISNPGGAPTISGNITITGLSTVTPAPVAAQGSASPLDAIDDRLHAATIHLNRATGERTLTTAHSIQANSSGTAQSGGGRDAVRWYEIRNLATSPSFVQIGTMFDSATTSPVSYWFGTVAMTGQGHIAVGASAAGAAMPPSTATAGRLRTDTLGTLQAPLTINTGVAGYNIQSGTQRWGDYSNTMVDPEDDQTIWTVQEYCNGTNSWGTRVAKLFAPPPVTPTAASPAVTPGDSNVNVTVTGTSAAGSAFYDTDAGRSRRLQASVGGSGVTVNSVTYNSDTQITLNLSVAAAATQGVRTITVTNPDGQNVTSGAILTVNSGTPVCPTFSQQPTGASICAGDFIDMSVAADGVPTPTYQWRHNNVNIPGATGPAYTILSASVSDSGSYVCVATNSCGSTPSNPAVLTVQSAPVISQQPQSQTVPVGSPASFSVTADFATAYQWYHDGSPVGGNSPTYSIASASPADAGTYLVTMDGDCGSNQSNNATLTVGGNPPPTCYPNCDSSTTIPFLNVSDFTCFLNKYAAGDPYANCDGSTTAPILNVADFSCFLSAYAAGCSAP